MVEKSDFTIVSALLIVIFVSACASKTLTSQEADKVNEMALRISVDFYSTNFNSTELANEVVNLKIVKEMAEWPVEEQNSLANALKISKILQHNDIGSWIGSLDATEAKLVSTRLKNRSDSNAFSLLFTDFSRRMLVDEDVDERALKRLVNLTESFGSKVVIELGELHYAKEALLEWPDDEINGLVLLLKLTD